MTDTTTTTGARRALLALLLDRVERDALLPNEAPLLRPLVQAEMDHGQAMIDQYVADAPWLKAREEDLAAETRRSEAAEAAVARVRELAEAATLYDDVPQDRLARRILARRILAALDGPSPTDDDTPLPGLLGTITDWAASIDEQCPAHYTGDSPRLTDAPGQPVDYRCGRRGHGLDSDHAVRQGGDMVFCWTDAIAVYPTGDAPSEARQ